MASDPPPIPTEEVEKFAAEHELGIADVNAAIDEMIKSDPAWSFAAKKNDLDNYAKLTAEAKAEADKKDGNNKKFFDAVVKAAQQAPLIPTKKKADESVDDKDNIGSGTQGKKKTVYDFWNIDVTYAGNRSILGQMANAFTQLLGNWAVSYVWMAAAQIYAVASTEVSGALNLSLGIAIRPFFKEESDRMIAKGIALSGTLPLVGNMGQYLFGFVTNNGEAKAAAMRDAHKNFFNSGYTKVANLGGPLVGRIATTIPAKLAAVAGYTFRGDIRGVGKSLGGIFVGDGDSESAPGLTKILYDFARSPTTHIPGLTLFSGANEMTPGMHAAFFGDPKFGIAGLYTSYYGVDEDGLLTDPNVAPAIKDMLTRLRSDWPSGTPAKGEESQDINFGKSRGIGNAFKNVWNYLTGKKAEMAPNAGGAKAQTSAEQPKPGVTVGLSKNAPPADSFEQQSPVTVELSASQSEVTVELSKQEGAPSSVKVVTSAIQSSGQTQAATANAPTSIASRWPRMPSVTVPQRLKGVSHNLYCNPFRGLYNLTVVRGFSMFSSTAKMELTSTGRKSGQEVPTKPPSTPA